MEFDNINQFVNGIIVKRGVIIINSIAIMFINIDNNTIEPHFEFKIVDLWLGEG